MKTYYWKGIITHTYVYVNTHIYTHTYIDIHIYLVLLYGFILR